MRDMSQPGHLLGREWQRRRRCGNAEANDGFGPRREFSAGECRRSTGARHAPISGVAVGSLRSTGEDDCSDLECHVALCCNESNFISGNSIDLGFDGESVAAADAPIKYWIRLGQCRRGHVARQALGHPSGELRDLSQRDNGQGQACQAPGDRGVVRRLSPVHDLGARGVRPHRGRAEYVRELP